MQRLLQVSMYAGSICLLLVSAAVGQMRQGKLGVGLSGSGYIFQSDLPQNDVTFGGNVNLTYSVAEYIGLRGALGTAFLEGKTTTGTKVRTNLYYGSLSLSVDLMPHEKFNPFLLAGGSIIGFDPRTSSGDALTAAGISRWDLNFSGGLGFDYFIDEFWAINVTAEGVLTFNDYLDGTKLGSTNDTYGRVSVGFRYHFFDESFIKKMIEAFEKRGK